MALFNVTEQVVRNVLDDLIDSMDCCKCEMCRMDIMAIALNQCRPQYVNTTKGELIVRIQSSEPQRSIDVEIAVIQAMEIVCRHPNH